MSIPAPDKATEQEVKRLLKRLIRLKGDWPSDPALCDLSPQMVEALLKHIAGVEKSSASMRTCSAAILLLFLLAKEIHAPHLVSYVVGSIVTLGVMLYTVAERRKRYGIYALTQTDDLRILSTLVQATLEPWGRHPQVLGAICRLLPQVTESHVGLLNRAEQKRLWNVTLPPIRQEAGYDEALAVSGLQAFALIGNREILTQMQRFACEPDVFPAHRRVNALIEQLIPMMEERLQRQEVPQTLLRASDASTSTPDTLLRAAHATTTEPTTQLLRASMSETSADTK